MEYISSFISEYLVSTWIKLRHRNIIVECGFWDYCMMMIMGRIVCMVIWYMVQMRIISSFITKVI